ncbi:transcriptional activator NhaR [Thalassotalea marina]|uniref:Transcriptional activator NhaR n=1 Tax=Thalassotalea marina TaxID=1673741 RepID=A0A919BPB2_9GAMM|nr:transcriptional activator NhaR [Thalassotalea marina]GHG00824.1 transcriptional activator NhaR [Thalassotalea marina]
MFININYNHLYYFWVCATEGGVSKAAEVLHLTPQTVSAQISSLEQRLGHKLFEKSGRTLKLTEFGAVTKTYADDIFSKAHEWLNTAVTGEHNATAICRVGVTDGLPKSLVSKWLSPMLQVNSSVRLDCEDGSIDDLLLLLSRHKLDLILTDIPLSPDFHDLAECQKIGKSAMGIFAEEKTADALAAQFPQSLHQQKMVMPGTATPISIQLEHWFNLNAIQPQVTVYATDIALMKTLGRDGFGLFAAPLIVEQEIKSQFHVKRIGVAEKVFQEYFLITPRRSIVHPAVTEIVKSASKLSK